jgi:hypothetical protein
MEIRLRKSSDPKQQMIDGTDSQAAIVNRSNACVVALFGVLFSEAVFAAMCYRCQLAKGIVWNSVFAKRVGSFPKTLRSTHSNRWFITGRINLQRDGTNASATVLCLKKLGLSLPID